MTYKTILVHAGQDAEAPVRLRAALTLGARLGAEVVGVGAINWDPLAIESSLDILDGETLQMLRREVDEELAAAEKLFRAGCRDYRHGVGWRAGYEYPARTMAEMSCCADLVVVAPAAKHVSFREAPDPADLIMESGLPVLVVPEGQETLQVRNVMIAWKNTRETCRAITDALPLLQIAEQVHVAAIVEAGDIEAARDEVDDVIERLGRRGIAAEPVIRLQVVDRVSEDLALNAQALAADVIVAGAYGHSRLREWALGGVTADFLASSAKRILFSR